MIPTQHHPRGRRLPVAARMAVLASCAMLLTACQTDRQLTASVPTDYRLRHPIAIKESEHTVQLFVGSNNGNLRPNQRGDVVAFADTWQREATGGIIIDVPVGTPNARAAAEVAREAQQMLVSAGVPARVIDMRPYTPPRPEKLATVRLNYSRMQAQAGPCGFWPEDLGPSFDSHNLSNRPYWNLGCANQRNLAAMVEDPADLVQPRGETAIYTARRTNVIDRARRGEDTSTVARNPNKGTISDIGRQ